MGLCHFVYFTVRNHAPILPIGVQTDNVYLYVLQNTETEYTKVFGGVLLEHALGGDGLNMCCDVTRRCAD